MSKRRSAESIAASLMVKPEINVGQTPDWLDSLAELPEVVEKARVRNVRQVKANINLLPELSSLIRDDSSLESYEKVAENLAFAEPSPVQACPFFQSFLFHQLNY